MKAFEGHDDLIDEDARKHRSFNPINHSTMQTKLSRLLPLDIIKDATVLDLGCCLGAAGQWALYHGAKFYQGVEVQPEFAKKAKTFLAHWGEQFNIKQTDVREFLDNAASDSYDIVVIAGVLHAFLDPQAIIEQLCRVAKHVISVESVLPPLVRTGKIDPNTKILQYCTTANNLAGGNHQLKGVGGLLSKAALDMLFEQNGFEKQPFDLTPPVSNENLAFSSSVGNEHTPIRFFERYQKSSAVLEINPLEQAIINQDGEVEQWEDSILAKKREETVQNHGGWVFDNDVAKNFSEIAKQHIPDYDQVIDLSVKLAENYPKNASKIIDVGCATGETLLRLKQAGFNQLYGVDNSQPMIDIAKKRLPEASYIISETFPVDQGGFDVVIANWTLHFIKERKAYLISIFEQLSPFGCLILTDKTTFSMATKKLYYDFKRRMGVSEELIALKEKQIQGVLVTAPVVWYFNVLKEIGFETVDIINAKYGFVSFLCKKSRVDE